MNIKSLAGLPWKLKDVVRALRHELAASRQGMAELAHLTTALEARISGELSLRLGELIETLQQNDLRARSSESGPERRLAEAINALNEGLLAQIREQGLLLETAARLPGRAAAELTLRGELALPTLPRAAGLSILITCWNHAGSLGLAVASAVGTLEAISAPGEVIILDDASRDGSREIAAELAHADDRIRLIASKENLGLSRARNVLLAQARFDHAMILDSDNQLVPSGVAALFDSATRMRAVLAYGNIVRIEETGTVTGVISNERMSAQILKQNWIDAMALVRTDRLLDLGGYDCLWSGLEDWELNQRLFRLGEPLIFVPVLVGKYRISPLSMLNEAPLAMRYRRALRIFGGGGGDDAGSFPFRACVAHPSTGVLWASAGWSSAAWEVPRTPVPRGSGSRLKVLVVSSGGVQNYGDDAILLGTLQRLRRLRPDSLASVVSDGASVPALGRLGAWRGTCDEFVAGLPDDSIRRGCRGNRAVADELTQGLRPGSLMPTDLKSFDVVMMAGGGNLNAYWPALIARRAAIAAAANAAGVPYLVTGQGIGPISAEIIPMLSFLFGGAVAVATRDPASLELLNQIVPGGPRMNMVGDDALGLYCDAPAAAQGRLAKIGVPLDRPLLAFQAREAPYVGFSRDELNKTARLVDDFAANHGYDVVAVPINSQPHGPEVALLAELAHEARRRSSWHIINHGGDVAAIAGVIKVCHAVFAHSYHVAIFALESRIPTLLFAGTEYYRLKAEGLRAAFGIPVPLIAVPEMAASTVAERVEQIAASSWSRGMTGADVDQWLDAVLQNEANKANAPAIVRFNRAELDRAG
jgi:polysaccharide pyruvyl transferase WcaK-like protein/GT2 family glycosyltransferase